MEQCLTQLETCPGDKDLLADIFRAVHTIKGATGFLGFTRLEALSHAGENLLSLLRDGKLVATPEIVSGLLALMDRLRGILRSIDETGAEGESQLDDNEIVQRLGALQKGSATCAPAEVVVAAAPASTQPARKKRVGDKRSGDPHHDAPPTPDAPPSQADSASPGSEENPTPASAPNAAPVPPVPAAASAKAPVTNPEPAKTPKVQLAPSHSAADSTLRVDVELLNRMMNLVGELVLTRNQILATYTNSSFALLGRRLDMVTTDLRESVMKARMQPVNHIFSRFPRLVRDLALGLGKQVRLEMEGQETELDKSLLEAIRDPLTHSIRNSIDHGIEMPEVRSAAGKPPEGVVRLRAYHEGSYVIVEVSDDGAGMNIQKIRDKAVERQLIARDKAEAMNERDILQFVFLPGFSTAPAVTSVSGRGVGMDVVRTNVEKIGGKVEIESQLGQGTILRLRIPLTLAIIPALIVHSRGQNFAVPQNTLTELVHLDAGQADQRVEWLENAALYRLRGHLLPLVFLDQLLQQSVRQQNAPCDIAILNADGHRFGLVVDGLADPEEIVVKPLAGILRDIGVYAGATILGNAEMALILNPSAIAKNAGIEVSGEAQEAAATGSEVGTKEFLLLEANGRRAALPLETVVRIERIPRSRIEQAGSRPVLRIGNKLLPLDDAATNLSTAESAENEQATVVVCRDGERHVGVTVSQVLDVTGGQNLGEAGTGSVADGIALLHEKVTEIIPLSGIPNLDSTTSNQTSSAESGCDSSTGSAQITTKEVCSVRVGDTLFGVPIEHVLEILDKPSTQPVPLAPPFVGGLVHYRGEVLTSVSLRKLLGMGPAPAPEHVLVLEAPDGPFGLFVDSVSEVFHVTDAEHEQNPPTLESRRQALFAGEWKLKDRLLVRLDPERLDPIRLGRTLAA